MIISWKTMFPLISVFVVFSATELKNRDGADISFPLKICYALTKFIAMVKLIYMPFEVFGQTL